MQHASRSQNRMCRCSVLFVRKIERTWCTWEHFSKQALSCLKPSFPMHFVKNAVYLLASIMLLHDDVLFMLATSLVLKTPSVLRDTMNILHAHALLMHCSIKMELRCSWVRSRKTRIGQSSLWVSLQPHAAKLNGHLIIIYLKWLQLVTYSSIRLKAVCSVYLIDSGVVNMTGHQDSEALCCVAQHSKRELFRLSPAPHRRLWILVNMLTSHKHVDFDTHG